MSSNSKRRRKKDSSKRITQEKKNIIKDEPSIGNNTEKKVLSAIEILTVNAKKSKVDKLTNYLFQFILVFLAVFLGYLAQDYLENQSELGKEKDYALSLYKDLQQKNCLNENYKSLITSTITTIDSLIENINQKRYTDSSIKIMHDLFFRGLTSFYIPTLSRQTISQLTYSGNMRLIKNTDFAQIILMYDEQCNMTIARAKKCEQYFESSKDIARGILDLNNFRIISKLNDLTKFSQQSHFGLLTYNPSLIKRLSNELIALNITLKGYITYLEQNEDMSSKTMELLRLIYHIKS